MKYLFTFLMLFTLTFGVKAQTYDITFKVDMNTVTDAFTTPEVNGTFNGWCGGCAPMTDGDGDGIWEVTIALEAGFYEYKFAADSWTIQEALSEGSPCTLTTSGFTNRTLDVSGDAVLDAVCWGSCSLCSEIIAYDVTFAVNMNDVAEDFTTPEVNGNFAGWCGGCYPLSDPDGDGIWSTTISLEPGTYEYKYAYDSWTGSETLAEGLPCTITTGEFTNRLITVDEDIVLDPVCWGTCDICGIIGLAQMDLPVTFDDPGVDYGLIGFGGAEASYIVTDPTDGSNTVAQATKSATAELWAGTTVTNAAEEGFATPIPFTEDQTTMTVRVWSPDAGIQVRLKVEDHMDPTHSVETEATTTVAGEWETLTFDFSNEAPGTAALNLSYTFDKASIFFNFGVTGAVAGEKTYYFDDIEFSTAVGLAQMDLPVTFEDPGVDYGLIGFGGAEASFIVTDPTDGSNTVAEVTKSATAELWAGTTITNAAEEGFATPIPFTAENTSMSVRVWSPDAGIQIRLKVEDHMDPTHSVETEATSTVAGDWETLIFNFSNEAPGTAELNLAYTFDKASIFFNFGVTGAVAGEKTYYFDDVEFYPGGGVVLYDVTFSVNMNEVADAFTTPEVNGTFNGWCGGCNPLEDPDGDNIWTATIALAAGFYEYKFAADGWTIQESLTPGDPCTMTTDIFTNRVLTVDSDVTLDVVCWGSCENCEAPACNPTYPESIFADDITSTSAVIYWNPVVGADQYIGALWNLSTGVLRKFRTGADADSYATPAVLTPSTTYGVRIKTTCFDEGIISPYSDWYYFTTSPLRIGNFENTASINPNPTSGSVIVDARNFDDNAIMTVSSVNGQMMAQQIIVNEIQNIDLSGLANGLYIITLTNDNKTEVFNISISK